MSYKDIAPVLEYLAKTFEKLRIDGPGGLPSKEFALTMQGFSRDVVREFILALAVRFSVYKYPSIDLLPTQPAINPDSRIISTVMLGQYKAALLAILQTVGVDHNPAEIKSFIQGSIKQMCPFGKIVYTDLFSDIRPWYFDYLISKPVLSELQLQVAVSQHCRLPRVIRRDDTTALPYPAIVQPFHTDDNFRGVVIKVGGVVRWFAWDGSRHHYSELLELYNSKVPNNYALIFGIELVDHRYKNKHASIKHLHLYDMFAYPNTFKQMAHGSYSPYHQRSLALCQKLSHRYSLFQVMPRADVFGPIMLRKVLMSVEKQFGKFISAQPKISLIMRGRDGIYQNPWYILS